MVDAVEPDKQEQLASWLMQAGEGSRGTHASA